jgi:hypothetical protein
LVMFRLQTTDRDMIPAVRWGRVWRGAGNSRAAIGRNNRLSYTQTENTKHFKQRAVSGCTVQVSSGRILATRHSRQNLAHVHQQHS